MNDNQNSILNKFLNHAVTKVFTHLIFPVVGIIIAYQSLRPKNAIIQAKVVNTTEITNSLKMGDIKSVTTYKDNQVEKLWIQNIIVSNEGSKTIIGIGNNKNIVSDSSIYIEYQNSKPLYVQKVAKKDDFSTNVKVENNKIKIYFEQWREGESIELSVFLETNKETNSITLPNFGKRFIVDGENNVIQDKDKDSISYLERWKNNNSTLYQIIKWVSVLLSFLFLFVCLLSLFLLNKHFLPYLYWKMKYDSSFKVFIQQEELIKKVKEIAKDKSSYLSKDDLDKINTENILKAYVKNDLGLLSGINSFVSSAIWEEWKVQKQKPEIKTVYINRRVFFTFCTILICLSFIFISLLLCFFP